MVVLLARRLGAVGGAVEAALLPFVGPDPAHNEQPVSAGGTRAAQASRATTAAPVRVSTSRAATATAPASTAWASADWPCATDQARLRTPANVTSGTGRPSRSDSVSGSSVRQASAQPPAHHAARRSIR
ncbi:hypothetical protein ACPPVO_26845 [Dactylosporangium sp. McL0621]|uniref:hypothetical protein n=1 Tax=Dactylosporangium sp. McL0621 TaxID=3415678 RepID=UPI003CF2BE55